MLSSERGAMFVDLLMAIGLSALIAAALATIQYRAATALRFSQQFAKPLLTEAFQREAGQFTICRSEHFSRTRQFLRCQTSPPRGPQIHGAYLELATNEIP